MHTLLRCYTARLSFLVWLGWLLTQSAQAQQAQALPFFEDFSTAAAGLDPKLWVPGSGVYINNTLPINQPSVNVATFDGVRANGFPYQFNIGNGTAYGPTDTLTSQPINLAAYSVKDSVYLSFYVQRRGLGELPDAEDSLRLQFLRSDGQWQTVWGTDSLLMGNNFTQIFVPVTNRLFLHGAFQFRFRSFGRQTGAFDMWHLDYIYLNRGRSRFDKYIIDVAFRQSPTPFLKHYTAMPLRQYLANPAAETADSISTDVVNLNNNFDKATPGFLVVNQLSHATIQTINQSQVNINSLSSQRVTIKPAPLTNLAAGSGANLRYTFSLHREDDGTGPNVPTTIDFRRNDTISAPLALDDYYAYDDGSAEIGAWINQQLGRTAMRFVANQADAVAGVRLNLVPYIRDQTGQLFTLSVYGSDKGHPTTRPVYQSTFAVKYPTIRNGFVEFRFASAVSVKDTFYIGFTQLDATPIPIGFDRNSPFKNIMQVNLGTRWDAFTDIQGVLMLRPIMGGTISNVVTAVDDEPTAPLKVYPNPTTGFIRWDNPRLNRIEVVDLTGRQFHTIETTTQQADLSALPDGFYLLRLSDGNQTTVQKIIVRK